jgi:hypothetical protein
MPNLGQMWMRLRSDDGEQFETYFEHCLVPSSNIAVGSVE